MSMKIEIQDKLKELTLEEKQILDGSNEVNKELYTNRDEFIIDADKIIAKNQLINIRKHTRFIKFPAHKHNYIEFNYVYKGNLVQTIHGKKINLKEGEIIFLNKDIIHELEESKEADIIINFIIKPEFFDFILSLSENDNVIFNFLLKTMYSSNNNGEYIYFKVSEERYIQEILDKIIEEIYNSTTMSSATIKLLVGLLIMELIKKGDKIEKYSEDNYDKFLVVEVLKYIDKQYKNASLGEISSILNQQHYKISKIVKKQTGMTFKELLQERRLIKAKQLLSESELSVVEIISLVGYENPTYFYKIFKEKYGHTPKKMSE